MVDQSSSEDFTTYSNRWQEQIDQQNYMAALKVAIEAYNHHNGRGDERFAERSIELVIMAGALLVQPYKPEGAECSFCCRPGSEVRLGAGPSAYICVDCVDKFQHIFRSGS
jgi:ClpX C4-type zinc finger